MQLSNLSLALTAVYGPTALTLSQLLPSGAGRVAAIYSDPARPSYDECIQKNMEALAAGRPQDCVLFSDAAGQTPVVYPIGAGQGKGLLLDRSAGLVRGPELITNGGFDTSAGWAVDAGWTIAGGKAVFTQTGSGNRNVYSTTSVVLAGKWYVVEFDVLSGTGFRPYLGGVIAGPASTSVGRYRSIALATANGNALVNGSTATNGEIDNISVRELPGHHQQQPTAAARGEFSRRYNQLLATATLATQSITAIATQYRLYFTGAGTVTLSGAATGTYSAGSHTITCTAGSLTLTVAGEVLTADLRFEADATIGLPEYQRVTTASDYDEVGFPTYWRAVTDDWAKSHMNPNGATKVFVFLAWMKLANTHVIVVELGPNADTTPGSFNVFSADNFFQFRSTGTISQTARLTGGVAGLTGRSVTIGRGDIANDVTALYVNGGIAASSASDQGTGSYLEHDVFFGSRAGTSLFANIREYAPPTILFLQPADSLSASHLAKLQKGYAKAVGVTL